MTKSIIHELETAVLGRNPLLAKKLQKGISEAKIRKKLERSKVSGNIDPILTLYSWKNGTILDAELVSWNKGFFPGDVYDFVELDRAIMDFGFYKEASKNHPQLLAGVGRLFPIFWDGSNKNIAVDLEPSAGTRIMLIDGCAKRPYKEAYSSFEQLLADIIRANKENIGLTCFARDKEGIGLLEPVWSSEQTTSCRAQQNQPKSSLGSSGANPGANESMIPKTENTLALRTDFSDEAAWKSLCAAIQDPDDEFRANVDFVSDPRFDGLTADKLPPLLPEDSSLTFAFIIDHVALSHPDHPILVIDLHDNPGRAFRVIASEIGTVENNLSIANMGFDEFANAVDKDGVFRGF